MEDFREIVDRYKKLVFSVVHNTAGWLNETEDIAQEVFIKAYTHLGTFRDEADMKTWIYRIAVTTSIDHLRKAKRREAVSFDETFMETPQAGEPAVIRDDERRLVRQAIDGLPDIYKAVLILKEIEGLSYREIARVLRCSIGTVESRLFRARAFLRERLNKYRGDLT